MSTQQSTENVVVVSFDQDSKAFQALTVLKQLDGEGRIGLQSASVITHEADGNLRVEDAELDRTFGSGAFRGGLIGSFVGILGGPIGVMLGWGAGTTIGMLRDANEVEDDLSMVELIGKSVPPGTTGIVAEVLEPAVNVIDTEMARLNGTVTRRPAAEVRAEVEHAQEAENAARTEASRVMRSSRLSALVERAEEAGAKFKERHQRWDEEGVIDAFKEKPDRPS